jgi:AGZA family xanthine/uracil permease-like MFS transporter
MLIKASLRVANADFGPQLLPAFAQADIFVQGAFALEQGFLLSATLWAAMTVHVIERRFLAAAAWATAGAWLALFGLIHAFQWTKSDTIGWLGVAHAMPWTFGYLALAVLFWVAQWLPARSGAPGAEGY